MARQVTRVDRRARFLERAGEMYDELEAWYEEHEEASFGDIEQVTREHRRELMGEILAVLINGRHLPGRKRSSRGVPNVKGRWNSKFIPPGQSRGSRGIPNWSVFTPRVRGVKRRHFFPLDRQLRLRADL